ITGSVYTARKWYFLERFAFRDIGGRLEYEVEYPVGTCCPLLVFYYDDIWPRVYPEEDMACSNKMDVCTSSAISDNGTTTRLRCTGQMIFRTVRTRWWFLVLSHCDADVLDMDYKITVTNGDDWQSHLSADETHMLEIVSSFFLIMILTLIVGLVFAKTLWIEHMLHRPYEIFLVSLGYELFGLLLSVVYYIEYVSYGTLRTPIHTTSGLLHAVSEIIFVCLLILLSKGYTITRARLSSRGQIKLSVFIGLYSVTFSILFFIQANMFDPGLVKYLYDSAAGTGIVALRIVAWCWFSLSVHHTVKRYPEKRVFYGWFFVLFSVWFLAKPSLVLLGYYHIEEWERTKIFSGVDFAISAIGFLVFLHLLRPSRTNHNFPFHIRTNQI
ncbi:predicted protein, partial [Nematostella vectensis]